MNVKKGRKFKLLKKFIFNVMNIEV